MYLLDLKDRKSKTPKLCFHGRIEDSEKIKKEIVMLLDSLNEFESLIIDLKGIDYISENCIKVFNELAANLKIEFTGYSLYIEDQLKNNKLIER